jgi:hypothetical protein
MKCLSDSVHDASSASVLFESPSETEQVLRLANREIACAYTVNGGTYLGPAEIVNENLIECAALQGDISTDLLSSAGIDPPADISVVLVSNDVSLNLTLEACLPILDPLVTRPSLLAWLEPPAALCGGGASSHRLMVKGRIDESLDGEL